MGYTWYLLGGSRLYTISYLLDSGEIPNSAN